MKIQKLELKNFGKFQNQEITLGDGLNLLYGENESGKTTIHTFIKSMLFGMERARGRAAAGDLFSRYEPWDNPGYYGGALGFESGGKHFHLERNFDRSRRRESLICLEDGEEFSLKDGDMDMLLPGLSAANYMDTLYIRQSGARTSQKLADELKNYAANYYMTGDGELDLAAAQGVLTEKKRALEKAMRNREEQKQRRRTELEQEASYVWREIHHLQEELDRVEDGLEKARLQEEQRKESAQTRRGLDEIRPGKWRIHPLEVAGIILITALIFIFVPRPWNAFLSVVVAIAGGIYIWNRMKEGKADKKTYPEILLEEIHQEEPMSREQLLWEQRHYGEEKKERQIQYENLQEQLLELQELDDGYKELEKQKRAIVLAMERLREVSGQMQGELRRGLDQAASEIIEKITGGKYTRLIMEEGGSLSFLENGKKIPAEHVSQGTLEQAYFAVRMAAAETLYEEDYPVILDDTFAFYDEERLANTLSWLAQQKRQVILFTCQKREKEIMERRGDPFRFLPL